MIEKQIFIENIKYTFIVGRDANENTEIIKQAEPYDLWFHVSNYPSCHVICKLEPIKYDKKIFRKIIKQGAICCKQYCSYKNIDNLSIDYTYIKNVTLTDIPGSVNVTNVKNIDI
jgi:predicted ribosome quality control (RQC) complex YloA/Tae2 family protein